MDKIRRSNSKITPAVMCRRVFAGILSLAMILTMLPMMSMKVSAASPTSVKINGRGTAVEMVSSQETTYWKNRSTQLSGSEADYNAKYDPTTHTLTLRDLNISIGGEKSTTIIYADGDLNVVLEGENKIEQRLSVSGAEGKGIYVENGSLTISGKGKLDITNQIKKYDNLSFNSLYASKNITIKDGAAVSVKAVENETYAGSAPTAHETFQSKDGMVTISGEDTVLSVKNAFGSAIKAKDGQQSLKVAAGATVTAQGTEVIQVRSITTSSYTNVRCAYGTSEEDATPIEGSVPSAASKCAYVRVAPKDTKDVRTLDELKTALDVSAKSALTKINVLNDITITEELTPSGGSSSKPKAVTIRGENSAKLIRGDSYTGAMLKLQRFNTPLTLTNITIDGNKNVTAEESAVVVLSGSSSGVTLTLGNGAIVENCKCSTLSTENNAKAAIQIGSGYSGRPSPGVAMEMQDGSAVRNNGSGTNGIAVLLTGKLDMKGGIISKNDSMSDRGAIDSYGTVNISGGKITGNYGIGIYSIGDLNITGGEITKNSRGVQYQHGTFTMSGGSITDNTATVGAGVNVQHGGTNGTLKLSGNAKISGNTDRGYYGSAGEPKNVYLSSADSGIQITGELGEDAEIGVGVATSKISEDNLAAFASGTDTYTITDSDMAKFTSDMTDWIVERSADNANELNLKKTQSTLKSGDFTFTAPADTVYDGTKKEAVVTKNGTACGTITVKYYDEDGNEAEPINAGKYTVKIDVAENEEYKTAENLTDSAWSFTITQKPLTVSVADTEAELGDPLPTLNVNVTGFVNNDSETTLTGFEKPTAAPTTTVDTTTLGEQTFEVTYSGGNATANYKFDLSNTTAKVNVTNSDTTAPVISGVEEGKTYCGEISKVTVTDTKLKEVTLNGEKQTVSNGKSEFAVPAKDGTQTIIAKDLAGNTAQITFTVNSGHTQGIVTDCTKDVKCTVCDTLIRKGQAAHTYGSYTYDDKGHWRECTNADCQVKESKEAHDCIYDKDATGHRKVCKKCAWTEAAMTSHTPGPVATEDTAQVCTECGYTITPPLGHIHKNHLTKVSAKPAACEKDGNKEYYQCSCGLMFADSTAASEVTQADIRIPQTGHQFATTYTHDGNNHWYACTNPGCTAVSGKEAHTPEADDGDCTTAVKCSVCGGTAIAAKQHDYGKTYQSNDKEHWQICKNAGCTHQTAKTKHTAGDWIVDTKATVEKEGSRHKECSICGYVMKTESIAKLIQYKVLEGADETVISHKDESLTLRADGEYPKFVSIEVDGKVVDSKYYTAWSGSTYVKFTKEFMDSLSVGHHTIRFNFTDGYAMTNLTVAKEGTTQSTPANTDANVTSPKTGNEFRTTLWAGVLLVSLAGMCGVMTIKRKKSQNNR